MTSKKTQRPLVPQGDEAHLQHLIEQRQSIADSLRGSNSRVQAETTLTPITSNVEGTQLALLRALVKQQDVDAADVLLALNELAPDKAVRKEARRALIQLAGSKIYPSWTPAPENASPPVTANPPRFWKGQVARVREQGEIELILRWEQGFEYGEARMMSFLLDFWQAGIKDFMTEVGTKRHIDSHVNEMLAQVNQTNGAGIRFTDCTLAEARRLLREALAVNQWRKTAPHKDYRHYQPTVQQLVFDATEVGEDRGSTFTNPDLEPDEMVTHAIGGWSMGDFGLFYDLLSGDSPLREGLSRDEWVERRYQWAGEAQPARLAVTVVREREHNQSALWLPGSFLSDRSASRRDVEMCWSIEQSETPLSGTLLEMPMGTAVLKETGRHWFWTNYTLTQEAGAWRIQRMTDEGANAQGLPLTDLQQRLKEHEDAIQNILETQSPNSQDARKNYEEIIWRTIQTLHYLDALLIKMPLEFESYQDATGRASSIGQSERAIVYLKKWEQHFPRHIEHTHVLQQLGALESVLAGQYAEADLEERASQFYQLANTHLEEALDKEKNAISYILLGEVKGQQGNYAEAQTLLESALTVNPTREEEAEIENDLGGLSLDLQRHEDALRHFMRVAELAPRREQIWHNIARTYQLLNNMVEAEVYYKRAIEEEPQNISAFTDLALIYINRHELDKAYLLVEQGARLNPLSAHLRGLLAGLLLDMGERKRAQAVLEEAERINPDIEIVRAVRRSLESAK